MSDHATGQLPLEAILSDYTLSLEGHFNTNVPRPATSLTQFQRQVLRDNLEFLARFSRKASDSHRALRVQVGSCPGCGLTITARIDQTNQVLRYDHSLGYDGKRAAVVNAPCRCPLHAPLSSDLQAPSGQVVIANDLRQIISPNDRRRNAQEVAYSLSQRGYDILVSCDSRDGMRLYHDFWRTQGMAYLPASNTSVTVLRDTTSQALVFQRGEMPTGDHEVLGEIITDLWAVCVMDRQLLDRYCTAAEIDADTWLQANQSLVVDVPRGHHHLTLLHEMADHSDQAAVIAKMRHEPRDTSSSIMEHYAIT